MNGNHGAHRHECYIESIPYFFLKVKLFMPFAMRSSFTQKAPQFSSPQPQFTMSRYLFFATLLLGVLAFGAPARTTIYFDGATLGPWEIDHSFPDLRDNFDYHEIRIDAETQALDWRAMRKNGEPDSVDLKMRRCGFVPAQRVVVRLRNLGDAPLKFQLILHDSFEYGPGYGWGAYWGFPMSEEIPNDGEWHEVAFDYAPDALTPYNANFPEVITPVQNFLLGVPAVPAGQQFHLQIAQIRGEDDVLPAATLSTPLAIDGDLAVGQDFTFPRQQIAFTGRNPLDHNAWLELRRIDAPADETPATIPLERVARTANQWKISRQDLKMPHYLLDGEYEISLHCGECVPADATIRKHIAGRHDLELTPTAVQDFGGRPTIHVNGKPFPGLMRATYAPGPKGFAAFTAAGIQLLGFSATPTESGYSLAQICEIAPETYDYSEFDRRARMALETNPDAYLLPRIYLGAPNWWSLQHPDELVQFEDEKGERHPLQYYNGRYCPSWSSTAWRKYTADAIARLVEHIRRSPFADRVLGFVLASGTTEEWMEWGANERVWTDYSVAAQHAFRRWLAAKYGSDQALQAAWRTPDVTLDTAEIPSRKTREVPETANSALFFPQMAGAQAVVDYNIFHAETTAECIRELCAAVKDASDGRMLAGPFYGYGFELADAYRLVTAAHLGVGHLVEDPNIDFLASPTGYGFRQVGGEGTPYTMGAAASLNLHNKFWFVEMDVRTSDTGCRVGECGKPADLPGDLAQQDKEAAHTLLRGLAQWWFDVGYVRYTNPRLMARIGQLVHAMRNATLTASRKSQAEIALVLDEESLAWTRYNTRLAPELAKMIRLQLERIGTTVDYYLASDLDKLPPNLRVVILPFAFAPDERQFAAVKRLQSQGRAIVYCGMPAAIPLRPGVSPDENIRDFTGMPLALQTEPVRLKCAFSPEIPALTAQTLAPCGNDKFVTPTVYAKAAPRTTFLATYENGMGAYAMTEHDDWTGFFVGVANPPRDFWLAVAEKAGVHRYITTPDLVWATDELLAICVNQPGDREITLRAPGVARDLLTNERFETDAAGRFTAPFASKATRIFQLEQR